MRISGRKILWTLRTLFGGPVEYRLPGGEQIRMFPAGQIPELLYTAHFEFGEIELVAKLLRPGMNVIDIGANVGLYSILSSRRIRPGGSVFAFEPSGESYGRLEKNIQLNQAEGIVPVKIALSDRPRSGATLRREERFRDGDRYLDAGEGTEPRQTGGGDVEVVGVTSLDQWIEESPLAGKDLHFLKMDIEGGEYSVFKGARNTLLRQNNTLILMFECTPQGCARYGHKQGDVFDLLRSLNYRLAAWDSSRREWRTDPRDLEKAGNVWASQDLARLPRV